MRHILLFIVALLLVGCKGQERIVETVRTEYKDRLVEKIDTVSVKDSTFVYVKGDTLYIYKYRDRWREKIVRDTSYIMKTDSIEIPVYIEKKLSFQDKVMESLKGMFICFCVVCFFFVLYKLKDK